jgi:ankyrin repeat protein
MSHLRISFPVVTLLLCAGTLCCCDEIRAQKPEGDRTVALFRVIRSGSADGLKDMLAKGADPNDTLNGYSGLMAAALHGTVDQMRILIAHGANVNYVNAKQVTALWLAAPDWEKTSLLLEHGAEAQHKIGGFGILVKLAAMPGTTRVIQLLIDHGADPRNSAPGSDLLFSAASSGDTAILGLMIRSGLNVNDTTSFGDTPLNGATIFRTFPTLKMLVEHGANVNFRPMALQNLPALVGFTALANAAFNNDSLSLYYLLEHGADPNLRTKFGYTPLMLLEQAETENPAMTQAMIDHGAVVTEKMPDGSDAFSYARKKGNTRSADILKKYTPQQ